MNCFLICFTILKFFPEVFNNERNVTNSEYVFVKIFHITVKNVVLLFFRKHFENYISKIVNKVLTKLKSIK